MPEIGEVARIVHYLHKHLVGKTLSKVVAVDDANIFGKVGTTGADFAKSLTGKKVIDAGQQGKYFWMIMSSPPHPVMHFGMTGWLKIKNEETSYYKPSKKDVDEVWPPKYWKFYLETNEAPKVMAAFVDFRRFSRIRLVDCPAHYIRKTSPLMENGPDPVQDKDILTEEWLIEKCRSKKIPIKALLLDQANISGIGNWVGDEIMYDAKIHPEQYSNTLSDEQLKQLHKSIHYICGTAVELLADSEQFPDHWLFRHRWGKGKKDASNKLPNGDKIVFLTVGGRTSAVVPNVQKKTGPLSKEIDEAEGAGEDPAPKKGSKKRKSDTKEEEDVMEATNGATPQVNGSAKKRTPKKARKSKFKEELSDEEASAPVSAPAKRGKRKSGAVGDTKANGTESKPPIKRKKTGEGKDDSSAGRRRSGRLSKS